MSENEQKQIMNVLTRIEARMENLEKVVSGVTDRLYAGNDGDTIVTRMRLAEEGIARNARDIADSKRSKTAIIIAVSTGMISMLTSIATVVFSSK